MMVGGLGADVQPCGDLRAGQAIADKFKDLQLPGWSARADWLGWRAGAAIRQKRQLSVGTPPTLQHEAYLGGHSGGNQQRTGQPLQQVLALLVVIVAVVDDGHDRPSVDQDHAAVPGSVRRISSTRSARFGSAYNVPALANVRTGSDANRVDSGCARNCSASRCACSSVMPASTAARSTAPIAATRSSGSTSTSRCTSSLVAMPTVSHGKQPPTLTGR